ncbi:hypothetical protein HDV00_009421 [Rhizophlyctis rosea]|nr:hypothetical protein HDV00_009421 [Rhizophlyctis rosea]
MIPLPVEILAKVLSHAELDPSTRFRIGVILAVCYNFPSIRNKAIPLLPNATMNKASAKGQVELLTWWKVREAQLGKLEYTAETMDVASANGHIAVLKWWRHSGLPLKWTEEAIDGASANGHLHVLQWWSNSGLPLKYTHQAMDMASTNGHVSVCQWWKRSGLPLYWDSDALDGASREGHLPVIEWWFRSGLTLLYTTQAIDEASVNGHIAILEAWNNQTSLGLKYTENAMDNASEKDNISVLDWWLTSGLELRYTEKTMDQATERNNISLLEWWLTSGLEQKYSITSLYLASQPSHLLAWTWWRTRAPPLRPFVTFGTYGNVPVEREWWDRCGAELWSDRVVATMEGVGICECCGKTFDVTTGTVVPLIIREYDIVWKGRTKWEVKYDEARGKWVADGVVWDKVRGWLTPSGIKEIEKEETGAEEEKKTVDEKETSKEKESLESAAAEGEGTTCRAESEGGVRWDGIKGWITSHGETDEERKERKNLYIFGRWRWRAIQDGSKHRICL